VAVDMQSQVIKIDLYSQSKSHKRIGGFLGFTNGGIMINVKIIIINFKKAK